MKIIIVIYIILCASVSFSFVPDTSVAVQVKVNYFNGENSQEVSNDDMDTFLLASEHLEFPTHQMIPADKIVTPDLFGLYVDETSASIVNATKYFKLDVIQQRDDNGVLFKISKNDAKNIDNLYISVENRNYLPFNRRLWHRFADFAVHIPQGHNTLKSVGVRLRKIPQPEQITCPETISKGEGVVVEFPSDSLKPETLLSVMDIPLESTPHALNVKSFIETYATAIYPYNRTFVKPIKIRLKKIRDINGKYLKVHVGRFDPETYTLEVINTKSNQLGSPWVEFTTTRGGIYYGITTEIK